MRIECPAFSPGGTIPSYYAKSGDNISPPLVFLDVPPSARSLALIMDDPDAPHGLFTHWVVFNLRPDACFGENQVPAGARHGLNSWQEARYGGPQPPDREHRYFFRLFAVDQRIDLPAGATREELESAMQGHVITRAELMGRHAPFHAQAVR